MGVRYVVSPWMEQQAASVASSDEAVDAMDLEMGEVKSEATKNQNSTVIEDKVDTGATTAYAVQLGSFSSEQAAKDRVSELKEQGIEAKIQLRDNAWKVVSEGFSTREEAKAAAIQWRDIIGDAFVVEI
ncbi:MAG: SPOR domain-containing protein [Firmicutes bacterium]|nr:SPOR domain-containing protein [Bacillota bacterium]